MRRLNKSNLALALIVMFIAVFFVDNINVKAYELKGTSEEYGASYSFV